MLFNTFAFLIFFILVLIIYWRIWPKYQWLVLLLSGYIFYAHWNLGYLALIILGTVVNYAAGIVLTRATTRKKHYFVLAVAYNLLVLGVFKYYNFFALTVNLPQLKLLLPLGISFYTFQAIGYLFDVYRGKVMPERSLGYMALFFCFFPQIAAGPIERAKELLPQFKKIHEFDEKKVRSGLKLFAFGLFKKLVIADNLAIVVNRVFDNLPEYKGLSLGLAVVAFSWQIYADFSGYTDMARGVARALGISLVSNFNLPYMATSIRDFWQRWHISLSRWLRDYLYISLGGNRRGPGRTYFNLILVFTLCGLWHGAAWTFVVWGLVHGVLMVLERILEQLHLVRIPRFIQHIYTYVALSISWVFFRANSLGDAMYVLRYLFVGWRNFLSPEYMWATVNQMFVTNRLEMLISLFVLLGYILMETITAKTSADTLISRQPIFIRYLAYAALLFTIFQLRIADIQEFIYIRF
jgi:D-alanyl-lipoteichoic acid acyltransferase DltB (MBOAT superfamily)